MTEYVTSRDGTRIAFDRYGEGDAVIVIGGLLCDRLSLGALAEQLGQRFCTVSYDRRGRGDSSDAQPYAVEREIEDLGALIDEAGGTASIYGHSSGAGLALHAAASGLPITRLVLHEPPYGSADDESQREARQLAQDIRAAVVANRQADAIKLFMSASGVPPEMAEGMSADPRMRAMAPTMPYDFEVMGDFHGGTIPERLVQRLTMPTLVIAGGASPAFFWDAATRIVGLLPNGTLSLLEDQDHDAPADVVAPVVADFLQQHRDERAWAS